MALNAGGGDVLPLNVGKGTAVGCCRRRRGRGVDVGFIRKRDPVAAGARVLAGRAEGEEGHRGDCLLV